MTKPCFKLTISSFGDRPAFVLFSESDLKQQRLDLNFNWQILRKSKQQDWQDENVSVIFQTQQKQRLYFPGCSTAWVWNTTQESSIYSNTETFKMQPQLHMASPSQQKHVLKSSYSAMMLHRSSIVKRALLVSFAAMQNRNELIITIITTQKYAKKRGKLADHFCNAVVHAGFQKVLEL